MNSDNCILKKGSLFESVIVLLCAMFALCRSFKFVSILTIVLVFCALLFCLICCFKKYKSISISYLELFSVFQIVLFINTYHLYSKHLMVMAIVAFLFLYTVSYNSHIAVMSLYGVVAFSVCNAIANFVCIISPTTYFEFTSKVLSPSAIEQSKDLYSKFSFLSGLSSHYSRNAYYCVAGLIVLFALMWSKERKTKSNKLVFVLILFEFALLLRIGKRGHLLFSVASLIIVYLMMQNGLSKKLKKGVPFLAALVLSVAVLVFFIPDVGYVFNRIIEMNNSDDISTGRFALYETAFTMFKANPIFGNGYGYFSSNVLTSENAHFAGVHNDYLQWLCELGLVGFVINVVFTFGVYSSGVKALKSIVNDPNSTSIDKMLIIWAMLFQTFVISYSLTGLPHYDYEINSLYYISCGVILGILKRDNLKGVIKYYRIRLAG